MKLLGKNTYILLITSQMRSSEEGGIILGEMGREDHRELRWDLFYFFAFLVHSHFGATIF